MKMCLPEYDPNKYEPRIHSRISIPDSAHRHLAYYLLGVAATPLLSSAQ
jgi:hypothetical protein